MSACVPSRLRGGSPPSRSSVGCVPLALRDEFSHATALASPLYRLTKAGQAISCRTCPDGSYAEDPGSSSCTLAKAGHYVSDDDRTKEIPCDEGFYSPGPGASECFACSAGSFSKATGATKCTFAKPGWFVGAEGDSKETECPVGRYAIDQGSSRCTSAAAGSFVDASGATAPKLCLPGRFADVPEAPVCQSCPEGYYAANEGTAVCSLAEAGYFADSDRPRRGVYITPLMLQVSFTHKEPTRANISRRRDTTAVIVRGWRVDLC